MLVGRYEKKWEYFSRENVYFSNDEAFWETDIHNQWEKISIEDSPGLIQGTQHTTQRTICTADHLPLLLRYMQGNMYSSKKWKLPNLYFYLIMQVGRALHRPESWWVLSKALGILITTILRGQHPVVQ